MKILKCHCGAIEANINIAVNFEKFLRSTFMIIILSYLNKYLGNASIFFQILIVLFNLIIFIVSLREKEYDLKNSHNNLDNIKEITH